MASPTPTPAHTAQPQPAAISDWLRRVAGHWPLAVGFLVLAIPTIAQLGEEVWSVEIGAHGPIVLGTGLWLLTQIVPNLQRDAAPPSWPLVFLILVLALPLYVFGRAYDFISLEALGLYGVMIAAFYRLYGFTALRRNFFPFVYLGFLVPPPGWVIDWLTAPLREFISHVATNSLYALGYPVAREGVTIYIAQYQLLVEDACSGMNSIVGLTAVSLFYIYIMHKASWRYSLFLITLILPIAILANIIRIIILILLTYYAGDSVAQGFLHVTAGIILFAFALALVFGIDALCQRLFLRYQKSKGGRA
ncbi:MAG: exosortase V [Novosphingobium sp.]